MRFYFLLLFFVSSYHCFSQSIVNGIVKDKEGEPVFAANVYLKSSSKKGVTTDFDGKFSVESAYLNDTLIVSFIGYKTNEIALSDIDMSKKLVVILKDINLTLQEVIITAQDPISEKFSVVKMDVLKDMYLNPVSQGDPLKAITIFPASTTTDESANVSLRGSSPDRSRVLLNGVPVYNPVRASNLNNQGFFSLFNAEIIDAQYVYASNPPLTYGNTSAGLVEIQTINDLESNQLQLSASLATVGFFLSKKIKKDVSFVQLYGNYQFSDAFVGVQQENLPDLKSFYTKDAGINFYRKIGKRTTFNSFNYYIHDTFNGFDEAFTYRGNLSSENERMFTVNNLKYHTESGIISLNSGINTSTQNTAFGTINSESKASQIYTSLNFKWFVLESTDIQFGISHDVHRNKFNDSIPLYYYAQSPGSPNYCSDTSISNHALEAYIYTSWDVNEKFIFSSGMRSTIPVEDQEYYFSSQLGLKYQLNKKHSFLLSAGNYHNYSIPNFYSKKYNLLESYQVALDHTYKLKNTLVKTASYFKNETGEQSISSSFKSDKLNTFGLEVFLEHHFYKHLKFTFSNSFINQIITIDNKNYRGQKDFNYLVKTALQYNNPKWFSLALSYLSRPGTYYNSLTGSVFDDQTGFYEPMFSDDLNLQYANYNRFDLSLSKYIKMKKNALVSFISLNNIFNTENKSEALYNADYSNKYFDFFQFRTVYFGAVWHLNY
tara:strand:+ start:4299 stop:6449 length:2151 start_codon:yes stop_codon:yes gene_type:complete